MSTPRFFHSQPALGICTLDEAEARHALGSLRLHPGAPVELFDGAGIVARGTLDSAASGAARTKAARRGGARVCVTQIERVMPPSRVLRIWSAAPKGERLDWLVEKCTELGVGELRIVVCERSVVEPGSGARSRLARTALEACKQCGRAWLPEIHVSGETLTAALRDAGNPSTRYYADVGAAAAAAAAFAANSAARDVTVIIGPEGGLTDSERAMLTAAGATALSLGRHVLRIETAAIAAAAAWAVWS